MQKMEDRGPKIPAESYDSIEQAVLETPRGRWFLEEFTSRVRARELGALTSSVKSLETAVAANHDAIMSRITMALGNAQPAAPPAVPELAPRHMKFFKRDEEIFEPAPQAAIAEIKSEPLPEPKRGAKLTIRRMGEASPAEPELPPVPAPEEQVMLEASPAPAATDETPKRRIVIIRHKPGETIDVPLQQEMAEAS